MKKSSSFLIVLLLMLASFTAGTQYPRGDVNYDGRVNIADVTCLIDYLLDNSWPEDSVPPADEHECVDLGLPSGTLWATCNMGADSPEQCGDYYAWGEISLKDYYSWETYKWCDNGNWKALTKYCDNSMFGYNGFTDGKIELDPEDDAAYVHWGSPWRIPSLEQIRELCDSCTWQYTQLNGVDGHLVTGPNGNTIFLPATGFRNEGAIQDVGKSANYSSRTLTAGYPYNSNVIFFLNGGAPSYRANPNRCRAHTIRPVRLQQAK